MTIWRMGMRAIRCMIGMLSLHELAFSAGGYGIYPS